MVFAKVGFVATFTEEGSDLLNKLSERYGFSCDSEDKKSIFYAGA